MASSLSRKCLMRRNCTHIPCQGLISSHRSLKERVKESQWKMMYNARKAIRRGEFCGLVHATLANDRDAAMHHVTIIRAMRKALRWVTRTTDGNSTKCRDCASASALPIQASARWDRALGHGRRSGDQSPCGRKPHHGCCCARRATQHCARRGTKPSAA